MSNRSFLGQPVLSWTGMDPVAAHIAHIRHLARASTLEPVLTERHGLSGTDAPRVAQNVVPFLEQAIEFLEMVKTASPRVRPVLQYYGYMNLAVACVLIYRPPGWQQYRMHGIEDLTRDLRTISQRTPVVRARRGAIPLLHRVISSGALPVRRIRLRDLVIPIPALGHELTQALNIVRYRLEVAGSVAAREEDGKTKVVSSFTFTVVNESGSAANIDTRFPARRMGSAMPILREQYRVESKEPARRTYISKKDWTEVNRDRAERFHQEAAQKLINFGGQLVDGQGQVHHAWRFRPDTPLLPTVTASLILSFFLASLARYRANILRSLENSKLNLLCEVFTNEADGFMIPAFRNLLYGENVYFSRTHFT